MSKIDKICCRLQLNYVNYGQFYLIMSIKYIAIAAITLDGKIAKHKSHMSDWTSPEDKLFMRALLDKCDVIVVGNNTYKTAIKPLSKRNCIVFSKSANQLISKSVKLLYCNPAKTDFKKLITKLKYRRIAILGGAQTYSYFLENNLLDEIYLTVEPLVFGQGISLFSPPFQGGVSRRAGRGGWNKRFKLLSVKKLNKQGSLLLHYKK